MAPIGFICDELNINRKTLTSHIVMDQLEQLYLTIDGQLAFTETQVHSESHFAHFPFREILHFISFGVFLGHCF